MADYLKATGREEIAKEAEKYKEVSWLASKKQNIG
jgi:hypothetical protein